MARFSSWEVGITGTNEVKVLAERFEYGSFVWMLVCFLSVAECPRLQSVHHLGIHFLLIYFDRCKVFDFSQLLMLSKTFLWLHMTNALHRWPMEKNAALILVIAI